MKKSISSVLAGLIFAAGSIAGGTPAHHSAAKAIAGTTASPAFLTCTRQNLRLRLMSSDAAMGGVRGNTYRIKNVGWLPCTLNGFPQLRLFGSGWIPAFNSHVHENGDTPAAVTLVHNGYAYFDVVYNAGGAGHEGPPCPFVTRESFRMPGTRGAIRRRDHIDLCGDVTVSPVRATETQ